MSNRKLNIVWTHGKLPSRYWRRSTRDEVRAAGARLVGGCRELRAPPPSGHLGAYFRDLQFSNQADSSKSLVKTRNRESSTHKYSQKPYEAHPKINKPETVGGVPGGSVFLNPKMGTSTSAMRCDAITIAFSRHCTSTSSYEHTKHVTSGSGAGVESTSRIRSSDYFVTHTRLGAS
jgi:hypothetical protein